MPDVPSIHIVTADFPPEIGGIQELSWRLVEVLGPHGAVTTAYRASRPFEDPPGVRRMRRWPGPLGVIGLGASAAVASKRGGVDIALSLYTHCSHPLRWARVPYVQVVHAEELFARPRATRAALAGAREIVAVSRHSADLAVRVGADPARVTVVNPGVAARSVAPPVAAPRIVTIGRLTDVYKGHDVLAEAVASLRERVPGIHWTVVGDGPFLPDVRAHCASLGLGPETVTFLGKASDEDRDAALAGARVYAMPARVPPGEGGEGFGIVFAEAAAAGVPVVAGNEGGAVDAVSDGVSGLLVDPRDPVAVAGALERVLTDDALHASLRAGSLEWAAGFSWERIGPQWIEVLTRAAAGRS